MEILKEHPKKEEPANLNDLLMELFTPEFLNNLPQEEIKTVIHNLRLVESVFETIPPEWSALRGVLQERGYLE